MIIHFWQPFWFNLCQSKLVIADALFTNKYQPHLIRIHVTLILPPYLDIGHAKTYRVQLLKEKQG